MVSIALMRTDPDLLLVLSTEAIPLIMDHLEQPLTIACLAKAVGVNVATIRFYQRKELLRVPPRPPGGIRRYTDADIERVKLIKSAQRF